MLSIFRQERDAQGREVVEISMNAKLAQALVIVVALAALAAAWFAFGAGPTGMPWFMIAAPIAMAVLGVPMMAWMASRSKVRVTIDAGSRKLLIDTSAGHSELRMADVERAEFARTSGGKGSTVYRLELVMRNGERVSATRMYSNAYSPDHQARTLAAINAALASKSALLD